MHEFHHALHNLSIFNWYLINKNSISVKYGFEDKALARVCGRKQPFFFPSYGLRTTGSPLLLLSLTTLPSLGL